MHENRDLYMDLLASVFHFWNMFANPTPRNINLTSLQKH